MYSTQQIDNFYLRELVRRILSIAWSVLLKSRMLAVIQTLSREYSGKYSLNFSVLNVLTILTLVYFKTY